jgi:NitT/TauT family transport system permease protein
VLVIANTVRKVDPTLLEAAQTLGAKGWRLVVNVVIPAAITDIYTDMRILLGWAWTYLIVAEVVGTMSGITYFIYQQARYRHFENVYAAIIMIGIIGITTDLALAWLGTVIFPWKRRSRPRAAGAPRAAALTLAPIGGGLPPPSGGSADRSSSPAPANVVDSQAA